MFCRKCGAPIDDGAAFCPNCGVQIKQRTLPEVNSAAAAMEGVSVSAGVGGEQLLFESKGTTKTRMIVLIICAVILIAGGIVFMYMSNAHWSGYDMSFYSSPGGTLLSQGKIGGGPMFTDEGQDMLRVWGMGFIIFAVVVGSFGLFTLSRANNTSIKVYSGHIEGVTTSASPFNIPFTPANPLFIQANKDRLIISETTRKFVVGINRGDGKSAEECARIIQAAMGQSK